MSELNFDYNDYTDEEYFNVLLNQSENDITCPESKIIIKENINESEL